jgi:hypothetical protein
MASAAELTRRKAMAASLAATDMRPQKKREVVELQRRAPSTASYTRRTKNTPLYDFCHRAAGMVLDGDDGMPRPDPAVAAAEALADACDRDGDGNLDVFEIVNALMHRPHLLKVGGVRAATVLHRVSRYLPRARG